MDKASVSDVSLKQAQFNNLKKGLPVDDDLFLQAVRAGKYRLINQILTTGSTLDINQKDSSGQTALLIAIQLPDYEIRNNFVKLLLKHSADVNMCDREGLSPLMHACKSTEKVDTVRNIIKQPSCKVNQQDRQGNTAIHWAARSDNWGALRVLINSSFTRNSVNLSNNDSEGLSPLETAVENGFTESCWVLIYEGKVDTGSLSEGQKSKLKKISERFPEIYDMIPAMEKNNNSKLPNSALVISPMSPKSQRSPRSPRSPRPELDPITRSQQNSTAIQMLTPLEGDLSYPTNKYSKLPAISSNNS